MSIRQMLEYADLRRQGDLGASGRLACLEAHRQEVLARMRELEGNLAVIERKIQHQRITLSEQKNGAVAVSSHHISQRKEKEIVPSS